MTAKTPTAFQNFRSWVPQQKINVDQDFDKDWVFYDWGPKNVDPLICLPGVTGTAESFYRLLNYLCPRGYRVISAQPPSYTFYASWLRGFDRFLNYLKIPRAHLLGSSLGGYLAQCYTQHRPERVISLILSNSFCQTEFYPDRGLLSSMLPVMPGFVLQRYFLNSFPQGKVDPPTREAIDFLVTHLDELSQAELAARLTLLSTDGPLIPESLPLESSKITLIDSVKDGIVPDRIREEVYKYYTDAKIALVKAIGNFPFLSCHEEFSILVMVHLRNQGLNPIHSPTVSEEIVEEKKTEVGYTKQPPAKTNDESPLFSLPRVDLTRSL